MPEAASLFVRVQADVSRAVSGLKATQGQLEATGASAKKMDAAMAASARTSKAAASSYAAASGAAATSAKAHNTMTPAVARAEKATGKMGRTAQGVRGAMSGMGMGVTAAQGGMLALAYGVGKAIKTASDFDGAMRNVNSIARLSETQFQGLRESVLGLAGPTAQTPQTLAEGMYQLVSSGFDAHESLEILRSSATSATAGLTDTATATTAVAGVLNAYHLSARDAAEVSDDLFQTVNLGVLSFEDLAQGIGPVLPFAQQLGVSLKQVGAMTATLTKGGVPAAEAFTYMKGAMAQLVKPSSDLSKQFHELGVKSGSELIRKTGSLQGALEALYKSVGGDTGKFAKLFPDIRGMTAAFRATGQNARSAKKDLADFNQTAGATKRVFDEQMKSAPMQFKKTKAEVSALGVALGDDLKPAAMGAMSAIGFAARNLATLFRVDQAGRMPLPWVAQAKRAASMADVKVPISMKIVGDTEAIAKAKKVKTGLFSIPSIRKSAIRVTTNADVVATRVKTVLSHVKEKVVPLKLKTTYDRAGNASTVVTRLPAIKVPVQKPKIPAPDTSALKSGTAAAKRMVDVIPGAKKTRVSAPGATQAASQAQNVGTQVRSIPKVWNVDINLRPHGKVPTRASGGRIDTALTEVNERGPESITSPSGMTAMLGDGRRQVMALPMGWHVNTATQTKNMFGNIAGLKGGGAPKRKKGEKRREYQDRYNAWVQRNQGIKDSRSDEAIARIPLVKDKDGNTVENTLAIDAKNISRAKRHLAEARKMKGPERKEATARAKAEIAQAQKQYALDEASLAASQANTDAQEAQTAAIKAQADAIAENTKQLKANYDFAQSVHTARKSVTDTTMTGILDGSLGGQLTEWILTNSPRWATP